MTTIITTIAIVQVFALLGAQIYFFNFKKQGLTHNAKEYIIEAIRKGLVMLDMVLSFIGQSVAVAVTLGLVFLGAAIVSAICD